MPEDRTYRRIVTPAVTGIRVLPGFTARAGNSFLSCLTRCIRQVDATPSDVSLRCKGGVGMRSGQRFGLSGIEKRDVWNRWKAGQSLHEIGRAFDKPHSCIRSVLLPRGGIAPTARRRSRLALTLAEREDLSRGIASDSPLREIARRLARAASTLSREISRHGGRAAYVPMMRIVELGTRACDRRGVCWPSTASCGTWLRVN